MMRYPGENMVPEYKKINTYAYRQSIYSIEQDARRKMMGANDAQERRIQREKEIREQEKQAIQLLITEAGNCHFIKALAQLPIIYGSDPQKNGVKTFPDIHQTPGALIAYKLAESVFMDMDFFFSKAINFTPKEKIQLIFVFFSFGYSQDENHFLLRRIINVTNDNHSGISGVDIPDAANFPLFYKKLALHPELLVDEETVIENANVELEFSALQEALYLKLDFLLFCAKKYPGANSQEEVMRLHYTNYLKDKHSAMLSKRVFFTRTKIKPDANLEAYLASAAREDKRTRCRTMLLNLNWFSENKKELNIGENAPAMIKLAWKRSFT